MDRIHVVTSVGQRSDPKYCWTCAGAATVLRNGRFYCAAHAPADPSGVTLDHIRRARAMMVEGLSLSAVAIVLEVNRTDLDCALWTNITTSTRAT